MKTPRPVDTPIDSRRRTTWQRRFASYRYGITQPNIVDWLGQFAVADQDIAARLLDSVEFVSPEQIHAAFKSLLGRLPRWDRDEKKREGRIVFAAFSSSAGESGDRMVHDFRLANNLNHREFDSLFIHRSDLLRLSLGSEDTVVFIDDFVGTGTQAVDAWEDMFQELTTEIGNIFFITVGAFCVGADKIRTETRMQLLAHRRLGHDDNLFHESCNHFDLNDRERILHYCSRACRKLPRGWGECGLLFVLSHQCPNNSIAVLHNGSRDWEPLFPRS